MKKSGIYKITNLINCKKYIGKAENLERRLRQHKNDYNSNAHLQNSIKKYGIENFKFEVIEYCGSKDLSVRERFWIFYYDSHLNGYNETDGGENESGWHFSEEVKQKMRKPRSEATKEKMHERMLGNHRTEEYWNDTNNRTRQSEKTKNLWQTEDYRSSRMLGQERYKNSQKKKDDDIKRINALMEYNNRPETKVAQRKRMKGNSIGKNRIHINNGEVGKMVYEEELEYYFNNGFVLGRKPKDNK